MLFSNQEESDPFNSSTPVVLKYLSKFYEEGKSYSSINTAKSAISSVCGLLKNRDIGNEIIVKRFLRGIFTRRPNLPRYGAIWDVNTVFNYISSLSSNDELTLLTLSEILSIRLPCSPQNRHRYHYNNDKTSLKLFFCSVSLVSRSHFPLCSYNPYRRNKANITALFIIGALAVQEKPLPPPLHNILF